jgi:oxygen-independent coproporphyrinogen-3 oxidase
MAGLYIHIPFCVRKCDYCAFYSVPAEQQTDIFFEQLILELEGLPEGFDPETIFIGGGTPSAPQIEHLKPLFESLRKFHPVEFSVEVNPGTLDSDKLRVFAECGVNRVSIGVQSFDDSCLQKLGRIHSAMEAERAFRMVREIGFGNINLDLMFGVPGQTLEMLTSDLDQILRLEPEHIALYNLMVEEGTLFARQGVSTDDNLDREMYDLVRHRLKAAGYVHYEISNFAKPGFECRHNLLYWTGGEYIGCGPSAHSHWRGVRWENVSDLDDYCVNGPRREFEERLSNQAKSHETLVMGLRLLDGVQVPATIRDEIMARAVGLEEEGLVAVEGDRIRLTEEALFVSNTIFAELI